MNLKVALRWYFEEERDWERSLGSSENTAMMRMKTISSNGNVRNCWLETIPEPEYDGETDTETDDFSTSADRSFVSDSIGDESVTMVEGFPLKLRQWSLGSRLDKKFNSCFVCLRQDAQGDYLDIYTRGPRDSPWDVFLTQHRVYTLVLRVSHATNQNTQNL